jgi:hypothetical protein
MRPPKKPSLAEQLDALRVNPLTPTLSEYAPGKKSLAERLEAAAELEQKVAVPGGRPPRIAPAPRLTAAASTEPPRPESPLIIKALRVPGKPADAMNAYFRRLADERRWGSGEETAIKEAWAAGVRAFTDLNREVAPTAIRATVGAKKGESSRLGYNTATVADYLISGLLDPVGLVTGPVGKFVGTQAQRIPAVARGVATASALQTKAKAKVAPKVAEAAGAAERALLGEVGSLRGQVAAHTLGVGPTARMMRGVRKSYEPGVAVAFKDAEAIVASMRDWVERRMDMDPAFRTLAEQYRRVHPGKLDPLSDAVRLYVRANRHKGQTRTSKSMHPVGSTPRLDPADEAAARSFAAAHRIPWDRVEEFGEAIVTHGEETLAKLIASGANPFEQARGLQVKKPLGPRLPTWLAQNWSGIPVGAEARSQDRLRRHWFRYYMEDILPHATATEGGLHTLGPKGIRVARGKHGEVLEGIQSVRRAGMRNLIEGQKQLGEYVRPWGPGADVPRGWVVVTNNTQLPKDVSRVPWTKGMEFAKDLMMPETLWNYMAGEMAQFLPSVTKAGRIVGVEAMLGKNVREAGAKISRYVGAQKRAWMLNPSTWLTNGWGNYSLVETRLKREGISEVEFLSHLEESANEALAYEKTAQMSPTIRRMSGHTRAFLESISEGAGVSRGKSGAEAAGVAGKRVELPGAIGGKRVGPVSLPYTLKLPDPELETITSTGLRRPVDVAGRVVKTAAGEVERGLSAVGSVHGLTERTFKLALFKTMEPHVGTKEAARIVDETLFDYSDRPALLEMLDRYGLLVFNAFPMFALKNTLETLATRPDLVARYPRLARLTHQEMGAEPAVDQMDPREKPSHLVATGTNTFIDPSRYFPQAGAIDWMSRPGETFSGDDLSKLPGRTAFSPYAEQLLNRRLYTNIDDAPPIVPPGTPPSTHEHLDLRARAFLNATLPGAVRAAGRMETADAGLATGRSPLSTPQTPAEAFLQGILGVRPLRSESGGERNERAGEMAGERMGVLGEIIRRATDEARSAEEAGQKNPYAGEAEKIRRQEDVARALVDVEKYLDGLAAQSIGTDGQVTGDGLRRIVEGVRWREALLARMSSLGQ